MISEIVPKGGLLDTMTTRISQSSVNSIPLAQNKNIKENDTSDPQLLTFRRCAYVVKKDNRQCTSYIDSKNKYCDIHKRFVEKKQQKCVNKEGSEDSVSSIPRRRIYERDEEYKESHQEAKKLKRDEERRITEAQDQGDVKLRRRQSKQDEQNATINYTFRRFMDTFSEIGQKILDNIDCNLSDMEIHEKLELLKLATELHKFDRKLYPEMKLKAFQAAIPVDRDYISMVDELEFMLNK